MLSEIALTLGYIAGILTALTVVARFGPFKVVFKRLVVQPATEWLHSGVHTVMAPLREENARDHAEVRSGLESLGCKVDDLGGRVDTLNERFDNTAEVLDVELGIEV